MNRNFSYNSDQVKYFLVHTLTFLENFLNWYFWSVKKKPKWMKNGFLKTGFFSWKLLFTYESSKKPQIVMSHSKWSVLFFVHNIQHISTFSMKRKLSAKSESESNSTWQAQYNAEFRTYFLDFCPVRYLITHNQKNLKNPLLFSFVCVSMELVGYCHLLRLSMYFEEILYQIFHCKNGKRIFPFSTFFLLLRVKIIH